MIRMNMTQYHRDHFTPRHMGRNQSDPHWVRTGVVHSECI